MRQQVKYFVYLVYYHLFRFNKWIDHLIADPIVGFFSSPLIVKLQKKNNPEVVIRELNKLLSGIDEQLPIPGRLELLLFSVFFFGIENFLIGLFRINLTPFIDRDWLFWGYALVPLTCAWIATERLAARKKDYLKYFRKFKQKSQQWHHDTAMLAFFTVIGIGGCGVGGCMFFLSRV